jgi:large subunit ribosomal protein L35
MPKIKTNKGAAKRFKKNGSGKIKKNKAFRRHLLTCKSTKSKRKMRKGGFVAEADEKRVSKLIPYA